jgi:hypothetical protein
VTRRERIVLGSIVAVALALRLVWVLYAARLPNGGLPDPNFYSLYGEQLASGNGFRLLDHTPSAYYPPGYVLSLWPFFWAAYHSPVLSHVQHVEIPIVAALNILWQVLSITMAFFIARRVTGRSIAGYVAAGALALWPNLIFHTAVALTESLFLCLLLAALLPIVFGWWSTRWMIVTGVLLGAATLTRPVSLPVFPALFIVFVVGKVGWKRAMRDTAVVAACAFAVLLPWMIRNSIVMHEFTMSTNTGDNLCMSRRVHGTGAFEFPNPRCDPPQFDSLERPEFETERDAWGRKLAIDFVKEHPGEELHLVFRRLGATFQDDADGLAAVESYGDDPFMSHGTRELLRTTATAYGALAGILGVAGLAVLLARGRTPAAVVLVLTGVGMLIPPIVFFGDPRFHVPAVPIVAIGVGVLATALPSRRGRSASG